MSSPIALVGPPNAGKTTLFNALTGSRYNTVNYPGATVEYSIGQLKSSFKLPLQIVDTPGTYSLFPKSLDESVCVDTLLNPKAFSIPQVVIAVVDATQLGRHLLLVEQLQECGFSVVVAITMNDLLTQKGFSVDADHLSQILNTAVILIDGKTGHGLNDLITAVQKNLTQLPHAITKPIPPSLEVLEAKMKRYGALQKQVLKPLNSSSNQEPIAYQAWDRWLMHPLWGSVFFFLIMTSLFTSIFWLSTPLMDGIDRFFSFLSNRVLELFGNTLWAEFIANGLLTGFGSLLVFVPQIAILFLGLSFLEGSGYLARAASLVDQPLRKIGLNGRSFVPLLSGFACAIPAMMAARTIPNARERWLTLFIIPLMSCSARIPVYALLLGFLFYGHSSLTAGFAMAVIYFISIVLGTLGAWIVSHFLCHNEPSLFMLELPAYRRPKLKDVLKTVHTRTALFVKKAGPLILLFSVLIWVGTTFPKYQLQNPAERLQNSYLAQAGQKMEPFFEPMGADWRVGVGLLSAFAAREAFVSSMAVVLNVTETESDSLQNSLLKTMAEIKTERGTLLFTPASVGALLIFFMIALQCMSTLSIARREFGNWRAPILQLISFNLIAYGLAVSVFQLLSRIL